MPRFIKKEKRQEVPTRLSEDFRIQVEKELKEFQENHDLSEKAFPNSLSNVERAFVHTAAQNLGLKSKSVGKGQDRFLTVTKKDVDDSVTCSKFCNLTVEKSSAELMADFLTKNPLSDEEMETLNTFGANKGVILSQFQGVGRLAKSKPKVPKFQENPSLKIHSQSLPIFHFKESILESISTNQVTIVSGETGSGKTTQVPKFLLSNAQAQNEPIRVLCTEPRRIAAISVSERVAQETDTKLGNMVGFQIRLENQSSNDTILTFCTTGVLLRSLMGNLSILDSVTHLIVDEIHERDKFSDFLLAVLKDSLKTYPQLKLILMSATIDTELFLEYFPGSNHVQVPGKVFPVKEIYLEDILTNGSEVDKNEDQIDAEFDQAIEAAFRYGDFEHVYQSVFEHGKSINYQHSSTGVSPLMAASGHGNLEAIYDFLKANARPMVKSKNHWTALDFAKNQNQPETVAYLEEAMQTLGKLEEDGTLSEDKKKALQKYFKNHNDETIDYTLLKGVIMQIHQESPLEESILVFLPGYDEIVNAKETLLSTNQNLKICLLHSQLNSKEQKQAFGRFPNQRKIILATNIAETSLTIDDVTKVIDLGKVKEKSFDSLAGMSSLQTSWISQNSATQRKGRAGRTAPGTVFRFYSRQRFENFSQNATPEILRTPLTELCLQTKLLAPKGVSIEEFLRRTPEPPSPLVIKSSVKTLKSIEALDAKENVTLLGQRLLEIPLEPCYAKMVLASLALRCLNPVLTIVCSMSYKSPFELPSMRTPGILKECRSKFAQGMSSDHVILNNAFLGWLKAKQRGEAYKFCRANMISYSAMEMIDGMRQQVLAQLKKSKLIPFSDHRKMNENTYNWSFVKAALAMGAYPNIARFDKEGGQLRTTKEAKVRLHPSCDILNQQRTNKVSAAESLKAISQNFHDWFIFDEMTKSGRIAMVKCVTPIPSICVALFSGPLTMSQLKCFEDEDTGKLLVEISEWLCFESDQPECLDQVLELRHKLFAQFVSMLSDPQSCNNQNYESLLKVICKCLQSGEEVKPKKKFQQHKQQYSRKGYILRNQ